MIPFLIIIKAEKSLNAVPMCAYFHPSSLLLLIWETLNKAFWRSTQGCLSSYFFFILIKKKKKKAALAFPDLKEQHWNMYITICKTKCKFDAWSRAFKVSALGQPRGMGWGGRWEGGSGWGDHVYLRLIHVDVWQKPPQYCKVISLQWK